MIRKDKGSTFFLRILHSSKRKHLHPPRGPQENTDAVDELAVARTLRLDWRVVRLHLKHGYVDGTHDEVPVVEDDVKLGLGPPVRHGLDARAGPRRGWERQHLRVVLQTVKHEYGFT